VANYSFVPPGHYSFQVIACNNDGIWNETGVARAFTVLPYFWQTWWFHILGGLSTVLAASGLVWFVTRRRMHRRLERLERQQVVERERARIARDIHDDLGASLTRISMLSQAGHGETDPNGAVAANLERIFGTAREMTSALDEIVWAVNPRHDRLDSLANYLSRFALDFLRASEIRCRLEVPLELPKLTVAAEVRHSLFLAFKEALHNVVKHAAAGEVQVELKLAGGSLRLRVSDNGHGFSAGLESAAGLLNPDRRRRGNGLANMQQRLADIGGTCEIHSAPGQGTEVSFSLPLRH
jgi:signal transduction histidine kinase